MYPRVMMSSSDKAWSRFIERGIMDQLLAHHDSTNSNRDVKSPLDTIIIDVTSPTNAQLNVGSHSQPVVNGL